MTSVKTALIATRNIDKFELVTLMLKESICPDYHFEYLESIDESISDVKETGDVLNRAYQKAKNAYLNIKDKSYDLIIGVDDGILINGKMIENVKQIIQPILDDVYLKEGEQVYLVKAFAFINKNGEERKLLSKIPFIYQKLEEDLLVRKNTYPLSNVFVPLGMDRPINKLDDSIEIQYCLKYSLDGLETVKDIII